MTRHLLFLLPGIICLTPAIIDATDIYVNNAIGKDANDGLATTVEEGTRGPIRSIALAIKRVKAGDTIHLMPTGKLYRQSVDFYGHPGGSPGKPITVDGHGVTLSGADPCSADGWSQWKQNIYRRKTLVSRMFLLVDGEMVFATIPYNVLKPGEFCYLPKPLDRVYFYPPKGATALESFVKIGTPDGDQITLDPKIWHATHSRIRQVRRYPGLKRPEWIELNGKRVPLIETRDRLSSGEWCSDGEYMYFRLPDGKRVQEVVVESIVRANGVQLTGTTANVAVKNLNVQHVYNDGYNIHGKVTGAEFYNCNAKNCGDEGFSAHDACETILDGAIYESCDNGIANVNTSGWSKTSNLIVRNSRSVGFLLTGGARHTLNDVILIDNPTQLRSDGETVVENVIILRTDGGPSTSAISCRGRTALKNVTAVGNSQVFRLDGDTIVSIDRCLFGPGQKAFHVRADDPENRLRINSTVFASDLMVEWGSKYPWKKMTITDWLAANTKVGTGNTVLPFDKLDAEIIEGPGASKDLQERWKSFLKDGQ